MKHLKVLALLGLGCYLLACSRQKASESPQSGSSDSSSKASSMSQARSKTASSGQSSDSQSSASAESKSSSQTSEKVREEETQPSSKEASSPIRKRLEVPMQIQRAWNTCAPTSVSMILAYRGVQASQEELARAMGTDETFGTHNVNAIRVLNQYLFGYAEVPVGQAGYHLATVTSSASNSEDMRLFKERLRKNIDDGYPLYYTIDNASIYPGHKGEHNVVGTGYELSADGSDVLAVYYIDPSYTVQDPVYGGLKKVTPEELLAAMCACQEPNYAW
ncbi:C39 family peptidase [Streptococcus sp. Marseille-P6264]|uniref:C39 family peptidase n=1 Tax=Streptococcus sp. Marseille-P6264 TaxID=2487315 RepID=UPI0011E82286|nr:C39 family peptidase [Streptococcus sp. Marseille-P6264]